MQVFLQELGHVLSLQAQTLYLLLEGGGYVYKALDGLLLARAAVFAIFWEVGHENLVRTHEVFTLKPGMRIFRNLIKEND